MPKVIVHVDPEGNTCVTRLVPWARLVSGYTSQDGTKRVELPAPVRMEELSGQIRTKEFYDLLVPFMEFAETEEEFAIRVANKIIPNTPYTLMDEEAIPEDRTFRNALKPDLTHDLGKARAIHMDHIRKVRDKELAKLDIETIKAIGIGGDVAGIEAAKQTLRDIPQTLDLSVATTTEELKVIWPTELSKDVGGEASPLQPSQL